MLPHSWISWLSNKAWPGKGVTCSPSASRSGRQHNAGLSSLQEQKLAPFPTTAQVSVWDPVQNWSGALNDLALFKDFDGKIKLPDTNNGLIDDRIRPCFPCLVVLPHKCFSRNSVTALGELSRTLSSGLFFYPKILAISLSLFLKSGMGGSRPREKAPTRS